MEGEEDLAPAPRHLGRANLPVPPPPFSYEVLSSRAGFDVAGRGLRFGLQLALADTLGTFATWLKSYRLGLNADLGDAGRDRWGLDLGYAFHWRWAARFTLDAGLLASTGWRALGSPGGAVWQVGLSPYAGFSLLPEGWIKAPLEASVSYQLPLTFYDGARGFPGARLLEGHMLMVSLGLAFMR
jgi:hypothetical protein